MGSGASVAERRSAGATSAGSAGGLSSYLTSPSPLLGGRRRYRVRGPVSPQNSWSSSTPSTGGASTRSSRRSSQTSQSSDCRRVGAPARRPSITSSDEGTDEFSDRTEHGIVRRLAFQSMRCRATTRPLLTAESLEIHRRMAVPATSTPGMVIYSPRQLPDQAPDEVVRTHSRASMVTVSSSAAPGDIDSEGEVLEKLSLRPLVGSQAADSRSSLWKLLWRPLRGQPVPVRDEPRPPDATENTADRVIPMSPKYAELMDDDDDDVFAVPPKGDRGNRDRLERPHRRQQPRRLFVDLIRKPPLLNADTHAALTGWALETELRLEDSSPVPSVPTTPAFALAPSAPPTPAVRAAGGASMPTSPAPWRDRTFRSGPWHAAQKPLCDSEVSIQQPLLAPLVGAESASSSTSTPKQKFAPHSSNVQHLGAEHTPQKTTPQLGSAWSQRLSMKAALSLVIAQKLDSDTAAESGRLPSLDANGSTNAKMQMRDAGTAEADANTDDEEGASPQERFGKLLKSIWIREQKQPPTPKRVAVAPKKRADSERQDTTAARVARRKLMRKREMARRQRKYEASRRLSRKRQEQEELSCSSSEEDDDLSIEDLPETRLDRDGLLAQVSPGAGGEGLIVSDDDHTLSPSSVEGRQSYTASWLERPPSREGKRVSFRLPADPATGNSAREVKTPCAAASSSGLRVTASMASCPPRLQDAPRTANAEFDEPVPPTDDLLNMSLPPPPPPRRGPRKLAPVVAHGAAGSRSPMPPAMRLSSLPALVQRAPHGDTTKLGMAQGHASETSFLPAMVTVGTMPRGFTSTPQQPEGLGKQAAAFDGLDEAAVTTSQLHLPGVKTRSRRRRPGFPNGEGCSADAENAAAGSTLHADRPTAADLR
eukprot:TRINITY_DN21066_c0_g1_i1.p1 TRINITY_DN21066_c0_g1~~TRINITY_DN21066_c0_g1_i1.p1  ORF type:complete len:880 (+),score=122.21 TRINITY_DN21066_c0_g1_i1:172-2811(+)